MAYLGNTGILKLKRSSPEPVAVPASAVNKVGNYITVDYDDWLLAEYVTLVHDSGAVSGYSFRDELDRVYLHTTQDGALSNAVGSRVSFSSVNTSKPVILAANANATQIQHLSNLVSTLNTLEYETLLRAWPQVFTSYKNSASTNPWKIQGQVKQWELSRSSPEIETGSIGDKFTTFVKSTVSGSGSLDFIVNLYNSENEGDVDPILRLVQLTNEGSTGSVKFYLKQDGASEYDELPSYMNRAYFFKADIILTASSISTSFEDLIRGSANFVTTGPIRLLSE